MLEQEHCRGRQRPAHARTSRTAAGNGCHWQVGTQTLKISFRPLTMSDLDNVVRWSLDREVAFWWHESDTPEEDIRSNWESRARGGDEKTRIFIISLDSTDIGVIQTYRVVDYPDHMAELQTDDSAGVDVFIGLPEWRNRGVGSALIRQFLSEIVFADPSIQRCVIDPEPDNRRAIRAYENAEFQHVRSYRSEVNDVDVYLMVRERSAG
ncbi:MAG: GNAT family N-acetyltransferase [Dehalococcoidia bacterium]|nr:GNAT family N-acetyltransferase [Dehalococcoidia bacterium]